MNDRMEQTPKIIIVGGIPGTGKTTISKALSEKAGISVYNKDKLEAAVVRRGLAGKYTLNGVGYELLAELALGEIEYNRSVILDCIASATRVSEFWGGLLAHEIRFIECVCSDEALHKERLESRKRNIPGWYELTWKEVASIKTSYQPFSENSLVLDSVDDLSKNIAMAIEYIG